jgi:CPA1 family monovalent cation:H+ antiporter
MEQFVSTETLIIELLLVVSLVAIGVRRLHIPYMVALVIVGLLLTLQSPIKVELTPELILALFVPPLIFEAAFHLNYSELQRNLGSIITFAMPGVVLTTLIVAGIVAVSGQLTIQMALVFGALIAATDPLAVVAIFRKLGVPGRLSVLVEGESLLNDGTAIVIFNLMLAIALTGEFDLGSSLARFVQVSAGGIIIGLVLGWMISRLIGRIDDYLIETTLTTVLAYGAYLLADQLHFSGVLAVVAAGLVNGNLGSQGMSPTTRIVLSNFWEYVAFLVNSIVFLLIGMQVSIPILISTWQPVLWAILAVLLARGIVIYGLGWLVNRLVEPIPLRWQHVLSWGGLRGAISLALALSLPASLGSNRETVLVMAYGVVLFTLLVQSTSMSPLIRWLRIITRSEAQVEYEMRHARLAAMRIADARLGRLHTEGLLSTNAWEKLEQFTRHRAESLAVKMRELLQADPALEAEEMDTGWRELFRAQRSALLDLRRDGVISEEAFENLTAEVDAQLSEGYQEFPMLGEARTQFVEVTIPNVSSTVGKTVVELGLPRTAVMVSIRRGEETIIPRGDTQLQAGDVVTTLCERDSIQAVRALLVASAGSIA